jgi:hypothetical protein
MNISVMVEQLDDEVYRATTVNPVPLVAEGETRQRVLEGISEMLRDKLSQVEIIQVEAPDNDVHNGNWSSFVGTWAARPDREQFEQNVREYRREVDADPGRL